MKRSIHKLYVFILIFGFLLTGCKVRRPAIVIPEEKMEELLYDYHIARAMGDNLPYNENYKKTLYVDYVFKKHGTSQAIFDSSMVWYTRHPDILFKVYEKVNSKLKEEQTELDHLISIRDNKPKISKSGDSIDVWLANRMLYLSRTPLNNKLTFVIPSDSNFKARDTLEWNIRYQFFNTAASDSTEIALMSMAIQYANDSIISSTKTIYGSGLQTIRLQSDTLDQIKEIRGFIYLTGRNDSIHHLFADQISLVRYHSTDSLFAAKTDSIDAKQTEIKEDVDKNEIEVESLPHERITPDEMRRNRPRPVQKTLLTPPESVKLIEKEK